MVGDDAFKKLQLALRQVAGRGEVAERLQHAWKGVAACGIVVDDAEGLETREHAILHDPSRELAAAQRVVSGCEVLFRAKAISTEHERSVHVEQDNSKAGEHAVRGHYTSVSQLSEVVSARRNRGSTAPRSSSVSFTSNAITRRMSAVGNP